MVAFGKKIGKLGYDINKGVSYFLYNPDFLGSIEHYKMFLFIFKNIKPVQVFSEYQSDTFQGLSSIISDSLPEINKMKIGATKN